MAAKRGGLGKGLEALFAENSADIGEQVRSLPLNEIVPNRAQPRKEFREEALAELADSIAQHGVLQPLLVRPLTDGTYQLVAGERRWRASRRAGLTEVPVVVREMSDKEAAQLALIENLQRQDLNPMEEAYGYRTLMETYGLTQEETAHAVNKSRPAVTNALRLLNLPESVGTMVAGGQLSAGAARTILGLESEPDQIQLANETVAHGLSVRELERRVKQTKKAAAPAASTAAPFIKPAFYTEVELALTEQLGRRVTVISGKKGGTLQLEFYDEADLQNLANRLAPEE